MEYIARISFGNLDRILLGDVAYMESWVSTLAGIDTLALQLKRTFSVPKGQFIKFRCGLLLMLHLGQLKVTKYIRSSP
jgi:hypothetical protein